MSDATDQPKAPAGTSALERVAQITGDRLCARCGYTLRGQTIEREPHYGLLIARCSECGTPAALQEYPTLAATAGRLRMLGLLVFLAAILALLGVHLGVQTGGTAAIEASADFSGPISVAWREHAAAVREAGGDVFANAPTWIQQQFGADRLPEQDSWVYVDRAWWESADQRKILGLGIPLLSVGSAVSVSIWVLFSALYAVLGAAWALMLLQRSRLQVLVLMTVPVGLGTLIMFMAYSSRSRAAVFNGWASPDELVTDLIWTSALALGAAHGLVSTWIGVWFGRSVARGLARALVPPELRGPLAILWFRDGLTPPKGAPGPSRLHPEARREQGAAHDQDRSKPV